MPERVIPRSVSTSLTGLAMVAWVAGCGSGGTSPTPPPPPPPPPAPVATITVSPDTTVLVPTGTRQFTATAKDANGNTLSGRNVTWSMASQAVATTTTEGLVTAVAAGTSQLTATSEGKTGSATITVRDGATIGATGGTATSAGGGANVTVPAGAVAQSTTITIEPLTNPPAHPRLATGTAYEFGPSGTTFATPVTIRLKYTAVAIASLEQSRLRLHRYKNGGWEEVPGSTVDSVALTVSGPTATFSTYAILSLGPEPVAKVRVTPDSSDIAFRATKPLTVVTLGAGDVPVTGRVVTWQSSDPTVATVSAAGVVTGLLPGSVTITATSETITGTARVRVVAAELSQIIEQVRAQYGLPAMGGAIVTRNGGVVALGVSGVRRVGNPTLVTVADKWHLGSNSKTFTAYLAAMTVKAGRLGWADALTMRYPELGPLARPEFATLDLRGLATMRSGVVGNPNFTPIGTLPQQRSAVDKWAIQQPPAATPGTYYYSNVAYQMLAEVIGRAWTTGYEQALHDRLWASLGITTGGFGPTTGAGLADQPNGHTPNGSGGWTVCEACDNSWATGSGKIHMSLRDWGAFMQEILRSDAGLSTLLSQNDARVLTAPSTAISASLSYGMGWEVFGGAQRVVTHDGSNNRNRSRATVYLDAGVAFILTTNAGDSAANGGAPYAALGALMTRMQTYWQGGQ